MKKLFVIMLILFFTMPVYAERWCHWSGTEGKNCLNDRDGILYPPGFFPVKIEGNETKINNYGYYLLTVTQPTIGEFQVRDAEVWTLVGNEMSLTWTVRDMTATEIDERIASPMQLEMYYVWRALLLTGTITQAQAVAGLPAEMIDAYQARARLLGD